MKNNIYEISDVEFLAEMQSLITECKKEGILPDNLSLDDVIEDETT